MKITLELAAEVLADMDVEGRDKIIRALQKAAEQAADENASEREPRPKLQYVIVLPEREAEPLVSGPRSLTPGEPVEIGWVAQIPEDHPPQEAVDRIIRAAQDYNATRRGQKFPCKTFGEACEVLRGKELKAAGVAVKTKLPASIVVTENDLPRDPTKISMEDLKR